MIEALKRICELQSAYSSTNTQEMQERGQLIRQALPASIRGSEAELRRTLGPFGDDFDVEASDGIGRKTEAPWVRIFSASMSPTPRDGYYVVIHFAADGSAVFVTVGCGSTIWANGDLRPVSDEELKKRTDWAREVIQEKFGSTSPFTDEISLGARAPLPRTFEKATAIAKRIPVESLDESDFRHLLMQATEMLRALYEGQRIGRDLKTTAVAELELETIARPGRVRGSGQGLRISAEERKAIEGRAMTVAKDWLELDGFIVLDKSKTSSFDYEATKGDTVIKVEVKGTTTDGEDAIFMTKNEVDLHTKERGRTGIIIVSCIELEKINGDPVATGGKIRAEIGWDIGTWKLEPMAFRVSRSKPLGE